MGMMDGIRNRFHVGMMDDDDLDDYDDLDDEFEEDEEKSGGFLSGLFNGHKRSDEEEDFDEDDEPEEEPVRNTSFKRYSPTPKAEKPVVKPVETTRPVENTRTFTGLASDRRQVQENSNTRTGGARVIPMSKVVGNANAAPKAVAEMYMIKPKTEEDARIAVDQLLSGRIVVINLEGLNLEIAQYVTDFVTGANYSIGGNFSTINSQVLVFAPAGVNMTGAFNEGQTDSMRDF
jgi:cell division inhibitor SepF